MYKVGDYIRIVRVSDNYRGLPEYENYHDAIGEVHRVVHSNEYNVEIDRTPCSIWVHDEVELDKNRIVHNILSDL